MKSKNTLSCCGKVGPKRKLKIKKVPKNPEIKNGVPIIYLGEGITKVKGLHSNLTFYATESNRFITIDERDINQFLNLNDFIIAPDF